MRTFTVSSRHLWWRVIAALLLCLASVIAASAQSSNFVSRFVGSGGSRPGAHGGVESEQRWDLAVLYSVQRSKTVTGTSNFFNMTGISANLYWNVFHGLGLVGDASFMRAPNIAPHIDLSEYSYLGGLRYTTGTGSESHAPRRLQIFVEGLGGRVKGFNSVFPGPNGTTKEAESLALEGGAGVDWRVGRKIGFRVVQGDFVQTYLPNGQLNLQRDIRLSSGFSAHF